jgi:hypothetical protein
MDTTWVRSPVSNVERPARTSGSVTAASSDVSALELAREDVPASGQPLRFDMNEMNGHIKQRSSKNNILTSLPRLLRPKRLNDITSQGSAQAVDVTVSSPALASSATAKLESPTSVTSPLKIVTELPSKIAELPVKIVKDLPEVVKEIPVVAELSTVVAELPAKAVIQTAQILKEQVVDPVVEVLPDEVVEQVSAVVEKVAGLQTQVSGTMSRAAGQAMDLGQNIVDQFTDGIHDSMIDHNNSILRLQQQVCTIVCTIDSRIWVVASSMLC